MQRDQWLSAIRLCTKLLEAPDLDPEDEAYLRRIRIMSAVHVRASRFHNPLQTIVEDFRKLWGDGDTYLLGLLAEIRDSGAIPALLTLAEEDWLPSGVRRFLEAKVHELQTLDEATSSLRSRCEQGQA